MAADAPNQGQGRWRASSRSTSAGNCVEFAELGDMVGVRDSKDPDGPVIKVTRSEWRTFIEAVKRGELG